MAQQGLIEYVELRNERTWTSASTSAGGTVVPISNASIVEKFTTVKIDGDTYTLVSVAPSSGEDVSDTMTVSPPLIRDYDNSSEVEPSPVSQRLFAGVTVDEGTEMATVKEIIVDSGLATTLNLREGLREKSERETVTFDYRDGDLYLLGVEGKVSIDSDAIDLTGVGVDALSDGLVPASSPAVTVVPFGVGAVRATWPATSNQDPVTYAVYASTSPGVTTASTLVDVTPGLSSVISSLGGVPIPANAPVYVRVLAQDTDGPATTLGTEGSASARLVETGDIDQEITDAIEEASTGPVNGTRVIDNTLAARKMLIGSLDNMVLDPNFLGPFDTAGSDWTVNVNGSIVQGAARNGGPALRLPVNTSYVYSNYIRVEPGTSFRFSMSYKTVAAEIYNYVQYYVSWYTPTGAAISTQILTRDPALGNTAAGVWTSMSGIVKAPDTAYTCRVIPVAYVDCYIDEMKMTRAAGGELVVDGAITTRTLGAEAVTADKVATKSLTADQMATEFLEALRIASQYIDVGETFTVGDYIVIDGSTSSITIYANIEQTEILLRFAADGSSLVTIPVQNDGISTFGAIVLKSINSRISAGGGLTIDAGVTDPQIPPNVTTSTKPVVTFPAVPTGFIAKGLTFDSSAGTASGGMYLRLLAPTVWNANGNNHVAQRLDGTTGALVNTLVLTGSGNSSFGDFIDINGIAVNSNGTQYFMAGLKPSSGSNPYVWAVYTYTASNGNAALTLYGGETAWVGSTQLKGRPAPYFDSTVNLPGIAYIKATSGFNNYLAFRQQAANSPGTTATDYNAFDWGTRSTTLMNVYRGTSLFGFSNLTGGEIANDQLAVCSATEITPIQRRIYSSGASNHNVQTAYAVVLDKDSTRGGIVYRTALGGNGFANHSSTSGPLGLYSAYYNTTGTAKIYAEFTNTNGGSYTTLPSPANVGVLIPSNRFVNVSPGSPPPGVTSRNVFVGFGTSQPANTALRQRPEAVVSNVLTFDPSVASAATAPPLLNTWPAGSTAWIKPGATGWTLWGDGTIEVPTPLLPSHAVPKSYADSIRYNRIGKATPTQSLPTSATHSKIIMNDVAESYGPDVDVANSRIYAAFTGLYEVEMTIVYPDSATPTGTRSFNPYVNGAGGEYQRQPGSGATSSAHKVRALIRMTAGHYVEFWFFQNGGTARIPTDASMKLIFLGTV